MLYLCAALGAQRFLLSQLYAYACVATLLLAFYYLTKDRAKYNSALVISVFLSVDIGAGYYSTTPEFIRYSIISVALMTIILDFRSDLQRMTLYFCVLLIPLILSLVNTEDINTESLTRDLFIAGIAGLVICRTNSSVASFRLDWRLLANFLIIYILFEVVNIAVFHSYEATGYLSYVSTKSLIVFPAFYFLRNERLLPACIVLALSLYVILFFQTRMIIFSAVLVIALYTLSRVIRSNKRELLFLAVTVPFVVGILSLVPLELFRAVTSMQIALEQSSVSDFLRVLDPVRFVEIQLFLDRDLFNILFGSGLGVGIFDEMNYMGFVGIYDWAFSAEELKTRYFYNFHDVWTDVGLRFGILCLAFILTPLFRDLMSSNSMVSTYAMTLIVLLLCAFFSVAGLIIIALIGLAYRAESEHERALHRMLRGPE